MGQVRHGRATTTHAVRMRVPTWTLMLSRSLEVASVKAHEINNVLQQTCSSRISCLYPFLN